MMPDTHARSTYEPAYEPAERRGERPPFRTAAAACLLGKTEAETSRFHEELHAGALGRQKLRRVAACWMQRGLCVCVEESVR